MTQQIFTRCKCGGELVAFGTRCLQCGPVVPKRIGHDWKYFDFASKARCIRCGLEVKGSMARVNASACVGGLTIDGHATDSDVLENAVMKIKVRTGPYTQAELDRAAAMWKPDGTDWQRWRLGYEVPRGVVEVIDCFGTQYPARPSDAITGWDTVVWYRVRPDLGVIGIDPATQPDATVVVQRAADFSDKRPADVRAKANGPWASIMGDDVKSPPHKVLMPEFTRQMLEKAVNAVTKRVRDKSLSERLPKAADGSISTVAGKVGEVGFYENIRIIEREIDKVCGGLPPLDTRSKALRDLAESFSKPSVFSKKFLNVPRVERFATTDFGRYVVDNNTGRKYIAIEIYERICKLADDVARDAGRSGLSRELRERAELAAGRVTAVNFTKAAPDEAIVTHLCEIVERLCGTDVAQLDQENARLRRELAEAKASRDGWQDQARTLMSLTAGLRKRLGEREDNVTYVEPFPDVRPYAGDWIPPSHKPRMLP